MSPAMTNNRRVCLSAMTNNRGRAEGSNFEAIGKIESSPSDLLGAITFDDWPPDPIFYEGQFREA